MYLIKNLRDDTVGFARKSTVDFYEYHQKFNFLEWIYLSKRPEFKRILSENPSFISDIAAAITAQLQESNLLNGGLLVQNALECCEQILISRGYDSTSPQYLIHEGGNKAHNVMLIPGCQSKPILKARVKKAFDLWQRLQQGFTFVFSGQNPLKKQSTRRKVSIHNEAREMEGYFYSLLEQPNVKQLTYYTRRIDLDEESHNTATNIREFLEGDFLSKKNPNYVYVVSSSFHLIRLTESFEAAIQLHGDDVFQVDKLILVGAEDPNNPGEVAQLPSYVKSMMHDVFHFLLTDSLQLINGGEPAIPVPGRFPWNP